eukprot:EG_transcript_1603
MAAATGDKNGKLPKGNRKESPQKPKRTDVQLQKGRQAKTGKAAPRPFTSSRTVLVTGCPKGTSLAELGALFPGAVSITLLPKSPGGPFSGTCLVDFRGAAEASAAAGRQGLKVKGQPVFAVLAGTSGEEVRARAHHAISPIDLDTALPGPPRPVSSPNANDPGSKGGPSNPKTKPKGLPARSPSPRGVQLESEPEELQGTLLPSRVPNASPGTLGNKAKVVSAPQRRNPSPATLQSTPTPTDLDKPLTAPASSVTAKQGDKDTRKDGINNRTVVLSGCPASTTAEELHTQFPTAESIVRLNNNLDGKPDARFLLQFPSVAEAEAMSQLDGLEVKGEVVRAALMRNGRKEDPMLSARPTQALMEDAASGDPAALKIDPVNWTVVLSNCPTSTTEEELQNLFPTADAVTLVPKWPGGPFSGRCSLQFSSVAEVESVVSQQVMVKGQAVQAYVAEAEAVVSRGGLVVKGTVVPKDLLRAGQKELVEQTGDVPLKRPAWPPMAATGGGSEGTKKEDIASRTVVLRGCPPSTTEAELSTLFPAAESITLMRKWWPGGPFSGRCSVRFATAAEAEAVAKRPGVIVQGQVVSACDEGDAAFEQLRKQRTVILSGCPSDTTAELLHVLFPSVESIGLQKDEEGLFNGKCYIVFPTVEEPMKVANTGKLLVKGVVVRTRLQRTPEKKETESTTLKAKPTSNAHEVATGQKTKKAKSNDDHIPSSITSTQSEEPEMPCIATEGGGLKKKSVAEAEAVTCQEQLIVQGTAAEESMQVQLEEGKGAPARTLLGDAPQADKAFEKLRKERTVILSGCPPDTTEEELSAQFPSVESIGLQKDAKGAFNGCCFLVFPTAEEAEAVVRVGNLKVKDVVVRKKLQRKGEKTVGVQGPEVPIPLKPSRPPKAATGGESEGTTEETTTRTVVLHNCPPSTTKAELLALFPKAEAVTLFRKWLPDGPFSGRCSVRFATETEAQAVAGQPGLVV